MTIGRYTSFFMVFLFGFCSHFSFSESEMEVGGHEATNKNQKKIIYLAENNYNGGVNGVFRGLQQASQCLGWQLKYIHAKRNESDIVNLFRGAVMLKPDAIVLGGVNVNAVEPLLSIAKSANIVVAGWHAEASVGPSPSLLTNITTEPELVASMAARFIIDNSRGEVGVVILNDNAFDIANAKTEKMKMVIKDCARCRVLSIENVPLTESDDMMRDLVNHLNKKFGRRWTHTLAINDVYFDHMNYPLRAINRLDIVNISAGDGSAKAISRIKSRRSQQVATVSEPLNQQGWQLADELNRAFLHEPVSGYVSTPILITSDTIIQKDTAAGEQESNVVYKKEYRNIWKCNN